jgi:hypothetical protein
LLALGKAGALLQSDVQIFEMARGHILEACRYLRTNGFTQQLRVPCSFPLDVYMYAAKEDPSQDLLCRTAAYAGQLCELQDRNPVQDQTARTFAGLENEIRVVVFYTTRRAQEAGVAIPAAPVPVVRREGKVLGTLKQILDSPQVAGTVGVTIMGLMSMFAMAMANSGRKAPLVVTHGAYADLMQGQEQAASEAAASEAAAPVTQSVVVQSLMEGPLTVEDADTDPETRVEDAVAAVLQVQQRIGNIATLFAQYEKEA